MNTSEFLRGVAERSFVAGCSPYEDPEYRKQSGSGISFVRYLHRYEFLDLLTTEEQVLFLAEMLA